MIKKLLPVLSLIVGIGGGAAAAIFLAPPNGETAGTASKKGSGANEMSDKPKDMEIVKLPNQFVVPVLIKKRVQAMVILRVALEVNKGTGDYVRSIEPKLRDLFLTELFGLAAMGGFADEAITRKSLELVRVALTERAKELLQQESVKILITDMARQDVQ